MSEQTSAKIAQAFIGAARDCADQGDLEGAILNMHTIESCRNLLQSYRRDAREIMDCLLLDYFQQQRAKL